MKKLLITLTLTALAYASNTEQFDPIKHLEERKTVLERALANPDATPGFEENGVVSVSREQANARNQEEFESINVVLGLWDHTDKSQNFTDFLNSKRTVLERALANPDATPGFEENGIVLVSREQAIALNQKELNSLYTVLSLLQGPSF